MAMCSQLDSRAFTLARYRGYERGKIHQLIVFHSLSTITPLEQDLGHGVFAITMAKRLVCYESRSGRSRVVKGAGFESGVFDFRWMGGSISSRGGEVLGIENLGDESGGL
jgi:hypothetical protein